MDSAVTGLEPVTITVTRNMFAVKAFSKTYFLMLYPSELHQQNPRQEVFPLPEFTLSYLEIFIISKKLRTSPIHFFMV